MDPYEFVGAMIVGFIITIPAVLIAAIPAVIIMIGAH